MNMKDEVEEMKKEVEDIKNEKLKELGKENPIATEIIKILKRELKRMYVVILVFIILLVASVIDSIWQRHEIIKILNDYEIVEETITETYEMDSENGNNNFIGGNNNGNIENN